MFKTRIVITDTMGCQEEITEKIVKHNKADYVLALKDNHKTLCDKVEEDFKDVENGPVKNKKIES